MGTGMAVRRAVALLAAAAVWLVLLAAAAPGVGAAGVDAGIRGWSIQWISAERAAEQAPAAEAEWLTVQSSDPLPEKPEDFVGMWIRLDLPKSEGWLRPALLVDRLFAMSISVYEEGKLIHEQDRSYRFERTKLLVPLDDGFEQGELLLRLESDLRIGIAGDVRIGEFDGLHERFVRQEAFDVVLGTAAAALGLLMLIGTGLLVRSQRGPWIALCLVVLSTGMLVLSYNPLPYLFLEKLGPVILFMFDIWMILLFPSLHYYVNWVFEGRYRWFARFGRVMGGYSLVCLLFLLAYHAIGESFFRIYEVFTVPVLGAFILADLAMILVLTVRSAIRRNGDSILLSAGFLALALSGGADLTTYYLQEKNYVFFLWKAGVVVLLVALTIILARRISHNHRAVVAYSKQLELYNERLQRTEKMKVVSDLAASVAHEVRNPMQVTRGFLQFLARRTGQDHQDHFDLAIQELDRASGIINDFLSLAKPEPDETVPLSLNEELRRVEAMMSPFAALHGGTIEVYAPGLLRIRGNASMLTQALINIVKNSIEATRDRAGLIRIEAFAEGGEAVVMIADNGIGMNEAQLSRLGEPFFSTKADGTGLGLMATYRLIEAMQGSLEFRSVKDEGAEARIRLPLLERADSSFPAASPVAAEA
ncbi:sensor histidine kinase [Cohnella fermenti]|uniref:histidine kinase n=1 Tax=Cohnella fermenti TaxID=2565925 RepID=A0A4S4C889_9BACL|nr:HAMP domain-containing sensor histidine kinase [Cohnella fermenti]THF84225.1 HAMP domain-containing histidine kinase [Cohnella fermenti]